MLRFYAQDFLNIARGMGELQAHADINKLSPSIDVPLDHETRKIYTETLDGLEVMCSHAHLTSASDQIARMLESLGSDDPICTIRQFFQMHDELHNRITDGFSHHLLFAIPNEESKYYEQKGALFGEDVSTAFPSTLEDIEEAGKCYSVDRSTACVFHLMHVDACDGVWAKSLGRIIE
jgi:hypothetical protein